MSNHETAASSEEIIRVSRDLHTGLQDVARTGLGGLDGGQFGHGYTHMTRTIPLAGDSFVRVDTGSHVFGNLEPEIDYKTRDTVSLVIRDGEHTFHVMKNSAEDLVTEGLVYALTSIFDKPAQAAAANLMSLAGVSGNKDLDEYLRTAEASQTEIWHVADYYGKLSIGHISCGAETKQSVKNGVTTTDMHKLTITSNRLFGSLVVLAVADDQETVSIEQAKYSDFSPEADSSEPQIPTVRQLDRMSLFGNKLIEYLHNQQASLA